ncbi:ankyrin repeat domain-containing protein [Streptosporangium sp. G11]|uniref:ankyrin repeat domain-containing protein n=1 Tax=Streptosporangium sp. G11 TaxID=3436926 RepID=UPI003EB7A928
MAADGSGSSDTGRDGRTDSTPIRTRSDTGADPASDEYADEAMLHDAAETGSPEEVAELARLVGDVDAIGDDDTEYPGRTALWTAVFGNRPDNARVLVAAGADPWRPMMNGWSPGRLSLAGPTPDLFTVPSGQPGLSAGEIAAVTEARRLITVLGDIDYYALGLACVAGIGAAEAVRRLEAVPADDDDVASIIENLPARLVDGLTVVGVTDVPGGCVVSQPWGYAPYGSGITERLSAGTVCYGMYNNPKGGVHGSVVRDGVLEEGDTHPGGGVYGDEPAEKVLAAYLYRHQPVAHCCAGAGLRLLDARAIVGPPDMWLRLPDQDR